MTVPLAPGDLLIASPGLGDPNFRRAVIVLCDHGPEGSLGLILTRPMEVPLGSVLPALSGGPAGEERVLQGGPVENGRLLGLRRGAAPEEAVEEVGRDLHLLVDLEGSLRRLEAGDGDPSDYRFFLGYSGWGEEQLAREIEQGAWVVARGGASAELAFESDSRRMWRDALRRLGGSAAWFAEMPIDPRMN